jgi:hypothetical protein
LTIDQLVAQHIRVPPLVPIREHFVHPERLSPAWTLKKGAKRASCEIWSHEFGF